MFDRCTVSSGKKFKMAGIEDETVLDSQMMFNLKMPDSVTPRLISTSAHETLVTAISKISNCIAISDINKYLFFAQIQDHPGEAVVQPVQFPCNFLRRNGNVSAVSVKPMHPVSTIAKALSELSSKVSYPFLIFIKMGYAQKNKKKITHRHYSAFDGKDLAVVVEEGDTFEKALKRDGRFLRCSELKLHCEDHHADLFSKDVVNNDLRNSSFSCTILTKGAKEGPSKENETPGKEASVDAISKDVYNRFIPITDRDFTKKVRTTMEEEVKRRAYSKLLDPKSSKADKDKVILSLAKKEFSNQASTAKPAWLLPQLGIAMKSVGMLTCGSVNATCFLISPHQIITNYHVFRDIRIARRSSSPDSHMKIKVSFDYHDDGSVNHAQVEVDEERARRITIFSQKLDFIILPLKKSAILANRVALGAWVRRSVPRDGLVTIIGHPQGRPKVEETCVIVPDYLWRNELVKRCSATRSRLPAGFDACLHMCKTDIMSSDYDHRLPYDTSLFEGASGSPVFNMDGHIICLHTQGYRIDGKSVMEFGVSFVGIFDNVEKWYGKRVARNLFPNIDGDRRESLMEIDG